jgi:hypothetical protein
MSERDHKEHELKAALTLIDELRASEKVCAHPCMHPTEAIRRKSCGVSAGGLYVALGLRTRWACANERTRGRRAFLASPPRHSRLRCLSFAVECSSLLLSDASPRVLLQERQS